MSKSTVSRISISLPTELLEALDSILKDAGYRKRSHAIQVSIRNFISEYMWKEETLCVGALLVLYDHEAKGIEDFLTDTQHKYSEVITSTMHIHLDERHCIEIIAVKGKGNLIKKLAGEFLKREGIKQIRISTLISK